MNAGAYVEQEFPTVKWTGGSDIHRSYAFMYNALKPDLPLQRKMQYLGKSGVTLAFKIFAVFFYKKGTSMIVTEDEFRALALTDWYRAYSGVAPLETRKKILNPSTGNRFHRIAVFKDMVIGVRFFYECGTTALRYRIVRIKPEEEDAVRKNTRESVEDALTELDNIKETMHIPEPSNVEETERDKKKVRQHE